METKTRKLLKKELNENESEAALKQLRIDRLKHQQNLGLEYITIDEGE